MAAHEPVEAPGQLELLRLFVNTLDLPDGPDALATPVEASAWCCGHGLPPVSNQDDCERLRDFREALRRVLFANNGEWNTKQAWEELRPLATSATLGIAVEECTPVLHATGSGADAVIGALLARVYDAVSHGTWHRLRACRKSTCRYAYYD